MNESAAGRAPTLVVATIAACVVLMVALAWARGGWLDEYWTMWFSDPAIPLAEAFSERWLRDINHPPSFYALSWLIAPLTDGSLFVRRLANGIALLLIVPTALIARRAPGAGVPLALFALLLASNPYPLVYFAEHRSYFLATVATACLALTLRRIHLETVAAGRGRLLTTAWLFVTALVAINLHYTGAVIALTLIGCATVHHWVSRRRATALWLAAAGALTVMPLFLLAMVAMRTQSPPIVTNTPVLVGWATIAAVFAVAGGANLVLLVRALGEAWRLHRHGGDRARLGWIAVLFAALVLIAVEFALLHLVWRNFVPRLLITVVPIAILLVVELATLRPPTRGLVALVCANALLVALAATLHQARNQRWEFHVARIERERAKDTGVRVFALKPSSLLPRTHLFRSMVGQEPALALSYRMIARENRFPVTVLPGVEPVSIRTAASPTIIWLEHNFNRPDVTVIDLLKAGRIGATPWQVGQARLERSDEHVLLLLPPAQPR